MKAAFAKRDGERGGGGEEEDMWNLEVKISKTSTFFQASMARLSRDRRFQEAEMEEGPFLFSFHLFLCQSAGFAPVVAAARVHLEQKSGKKKLNCK